MTNYLDYPCECGHLAGSHDLTPTNIFMLCCIVGCRCGDYKPDNLRYLEMQTYVK